MWNIGFRSGHVSKMTDLSIGALTVTFLQLLAIVTADCIACGVLVLFIFSGGLLAIVVYQSIQQSNFTLGGPSLFICHMISNKNITTLLSMLSGDLRYASTRHDV